MFSGLVQCVGVITSHSNHHISVRVTSMNVKPGDSVAVNGVCLTVTKKLKFPDGLNLFFDISRETRAKTTMGRLPPGTKVNMERSLTMMDTLGGHIVQGHADGVGRVAKIRTEKRGKNMWFEAPKEILDFIVSKGSVAVDGVSLTVARVSSKMFSVALIPFTLRHTNLGSLQKGDRVNLETDIIGKYVAKYLKKK